MRLSFALTIVALLCSAQLAFADSTTLYRTFQALVKNDATITGAAVSSQDTTRVLSENSGAFGWASSSLQTPYGSDTPARINNLGETLVAIAIYQLAELSFLPAIESTTAIPAKYLPRGIQLASPSFPTTTITLKHLLNHVSGITDARFATFAKTSPDAVLDIISFGEAYFLSSSGGTFAVATDIWSTGQPGASASYQYAKANVALLTYIIEQVVRSSQSLVASSQKTAISYIYEKVIAPLGMSNTFVRMVDGTLPTISFPDAGPIFGSAVAQDVAGTTEMTRFPLHPAVYAQVMAYSTANDIAKLLRALFLDTSSTARFFAIGTKMKSSPVSVSGLSTAAKGQLSQGSGLSFYDGAVVCAAGLATATITKCPFTATSSLWGFVATGDFSQAGFLCSNAINSANPVCVSSMISYRSAVTSGVSLKSNDLTNSMLAVAFQGTVGDSSTVSQTAVQVSSANALYGLWVFFGVIAVLIFTVVSAYATEYIIQPAPPLTGVVPPTAQPQAPRDTYFGDN